MLSGSTLTCCYSFSSYLEGPLPDLLSLTSDLMILDCRLRLLLMSIVRWLLKGFLLLTYPLFPSSGLRSLHIFPAYDLPGYSGNV
jgi:hypothetical protein